ncbi:hypothetical protein N7462_005132 [Penicillium macrosclerotiorum]|uniref:uncharacterized protein n=1 Tax=Penicillium macrosclerotiorum TaxID=303699 RepID=UPI002549AE4B|nr:uncharacterized protein N7462_005132 [Penicillium macrosclerotiorum]KAJ5690740.1 hypothetical protein N7462_005132 [Penicillium macrosclerotiorum]
MYLIAACLVSYLPLVKFLWRKVRGTEKLSSSDSHHLSTVGGGSSAHDRGLKPFKRHANGTESSWDIIEPVTVVGGSDSPDRERNPPGQIVLERQFIVE